MGTDKEFKVYTKFTCPDCGKTDEVIEHFEDGYGDGDSLDFYCECGAYFKKIWRIPEECIISRTREEVPETICKREGFPFRPQVYFTAIRRGDDK
jgi:acetone carboxylase gamma subunit